MTKYFVFKKTGDEVLHVRMKGPLTGNTYKVAQGFKSNKKAPQNGAFFMG
jgi:hypothetical protein